MDRPLTNIDKLRKASRHPIAFVLGAILGVLISFITLTSKIDAMRVTHWFYLLAAAGGLFSLMSLWKFGRAAFGHDRYGLWKTLTFCAIIEIAWLVLPYNILPNQDVPIYGLTVPAEVQWLSLITALFCFCIASAVNGIEVAAFMVKDLEASETPDTAPDAEQNQQMRDHYQAIIAVLETCYRSNPRRSPRLKLAENTYILADDRSGQTVALYPPHAEIPAPERDLAPLP